MVKKAKLPNLSSSLPAMKPTLMLSDGTQSTVYTKRPDPWRHLYKKAKWARLRIEVFVRDMFTCQMCGRITADTSKLACDHKIPHRGNLERFWDKDNLQTLCIDPCHNEFKKRQDFAIPKGHWD